MPMPMKMKPRNARLGPMIMRRVEKTSGLNWSGAVDAPPEVRMNPIMIIAAAIAIRMKLIRRRGNWDSGSFLSSDSEGDDVVVFFAI